jgi:hypothetical protein
MSVEVMFRKNLSSNGGEVWPLYARRIFRAES